VTVSEPPSNAAGRKSFGLPECCVVRPDGRPRGSHARPAVAPTSMNRRGLKTGGGSLDTSPCGGIQRGIKMAADEAPSCALASDGRASRRGRVPADPDRGRLACVLNPQRWRRFRTIVAGVLLAVAGLLLIVATHWGKFG
jgi:hypothetical protein